MSELCVCKAKPLDDKRFPLCISCRRFKNKFQESPFEVDEKLIYSNYLIELKYDVNFSILDSCRCFSAKPTLFTKTYPLLKVFHKSDIDIDNNIDPKNKKLEYYQQVHTLCGNCGTAIFYSILNAKVLHKPPRIILDD